MGCPLTIEARTSGRKLSENDQRAESEVAIECNTIKIRYSVVSCTILSLDDMSVSS